MHYTNSEANAAAERELDRDLDRHLEEDGAQTESAYIVTVDVRMVAASEEEAISQLKMYLHRYIASSDISIIETEKEDAL